MKYYLYWWYYTYILWIILYRTIVKTTNNMVSTVILLRPLSLWHPCSEPIGIRVRAIVFNDTFNNMSVISRRSILLVEETGVPGDNRRSAASYWQTWSYDVVSSIPRLSGIRTHNITGDRILIALVVINPTTIRSWPHRPFRTNDI